jgi:hypothetical protein
MHEHYLIYIAIIHLIVVIVNIWLYIHNSTFLIYVTVTVFKANIISSERGVEHVT